MRRSEKTEYSESFHSALIARCGMNCGICIGHLREKNRCMGCNADDARKSKHCVVCRIRNCVVTEVREQKFCFECDTFPCTRLSQLDKRYRMKYGMSMIGNLHGIRELGLEGFVSRERDRWKCKECGGVICVHRASCIYCGHYWR